MRPVDPESRFPQGGCVRWARVAAFFFLILGGALSVAQDARAQLPHLDAIPWYTPADSTSRLALVVDVDRFHDSKFGWDLNRLLLTAILPAGDDGVFFLRLPLMTFDTGGLSLQSRWPWVIGEGAPEGWPHEERVSSYGQIEVGINGPVKLPLVTWVNYGLALGLPTGSDKVYPFSSTGMPLRLALKKNLPLGRTTYLGLVAGYLAHMDSGKDNLDPYAFPSGVHLGATFDVFRDRGSRFLLSYDYHNRESRKSQMAGAQVWIPWSEDGSIGFKAARELQGTLDRPAEWYFTLSFRLDSPNHRLRADPEEAVAP
jgi:hypothetical protein